jgi:hypothetical protein
MASSILGQQYPYWSQIKSPGELGMSGDGNLEALGRDINGLIQYVEVLVTGGGASKTGGPLGNKYFLDTGGKCADVTDNSCKDKDSSCTSNLKKRFIYINNVPTGNIPFISSGMGTNFSEFRGLIPGTMQNLNVLNPEGIISAFTTGITPPCTAVTLQTIDSNDNVGSDTKYIALADIRQMDACSFDGGNPVTGKQCREAMTALSPAPVLPSVPSIQLYYLILGLLALYILFRLMNRA